MSVSSNWFRWWEDDAMTSVLDRAKQMLGCDHQHTEADTVITAFIQETKEADPWALKVKDFSAGRTALDASPESQVILLIGICERADTESDYRIIHRLEKLASALFVRTLPFSAADIERLMVACQRQAGNGYYYRLHLWSGITRVTSRFLDAGNALTLPMREILAETQGRIKAYRNRDISKISITINELLGDTMAGQPDPSERWADTAIAEIGTSEAWKSVFAHAATADGGKPSVKWLKEAEKHQNAIGKAAFQQRVTAWLNLTVPPPAFDITAPVYGDTVVYEDFQNANKEYRVALLEYHNSISEKNISILKGLAWYSSISDSPELARALGHFGEAAFGNVRERGAWAKSAGNAAIWALGQMPGGVGVAPLARLRTKLRDRGALKLIASSIEAAAKNAGMTVDELEDLAVPTGGLDADGTRQETFGEDGSAVLTLDAKNAKTNLQWFGADGKERKAVPAAVKKNWPVEVKALKAAEEEIRQTLTAQSARFDSFLMDEREWTYAQWQERYLALPILGNLARRLIWVVDGLPTLPDDLPKTLPDTVPVKLWHPLGASLEDVLRWRQTLEARQIVQPFKQAHREVYLLTDAERNTRTYSNRFGAHIIKQHQFNSLCVLRGWKNSLRLMVDDSYPPATRLLPRWNLRAEFWVEGIGDDYGTDTNDAGTYLRLVTDQVRFYRLEAPENSAHAGGGGYTGQGWGQGPAEALPLDQVPPLAFSEVMRDVDLFVGVASVGNDPAWADGGPQGRHVQYWQDYAFGDLTETAKTRAEVLARLLPRLRIADRCLVDGKFLQVRGDLRTYKIHLGSGNILMAPNDQYLCIVPGSRSEDAQSNLFLPFEGDRTLAVILSKAFLLAADTKITDPTITRQIGVR
jgi:hypothetical protein